MTKRVLVLGAQVPFERGGAENLNAGLVQAIATHLPDVEVDLVQLPFKNYPEQRLLAELMSWRLTDLTEANGRRVDLVIATKFPTYAARHSNKVLWLVHQYRQAYDLAGTIYDNRELTELERTARRKLHELDTRFIGECKARFAISETVAERLRRFNNLLSIPLSPPSLLQAKIAPGPYSDTMLFFGRLALNKRASLMLDAMKLVPEAKVLICGEGAEERSLRELADRHGLGERCRFVGRVSDEVLIAELAQSRAVLYGPFDEDYGYATIEAFLAEKPVITCRDSGEAARIVAGTGGGWVVEPSPPAIAAAISAAYRASNAELATLGRAGATFARELNWRHVVDTLVVPYL